MEVGLEEWKWRLKSNKKSGLLKKWAVDRRYPLVAYMLCGVHNCEISVYHSTVTMVMAMVMIRKQWAIKDWQSRIACEVRGVAFGFRSLVSLFILLFLVHFIIIN